MNRFLEILFLIGLLAAPALLVWLYGFISPLRHQRTNATYERWVIIPLVLPFICLLAGTFGALSQFTQLQYAIVAFITLASCIIGIDYMYRLSKKNKWVLLITLVYYLLFFLFIFIILVAGGGIY